MIEKLTYKTKLWLLGTTTLVAILCVWNFGISRTWQEYSRYKELATSAEHEDQITERISQIKGGLGDYHNSPYLVNNDTSSISHHETLLASITQLASSNDLTIRSFPPEVVFQESDYEIAKHEILIEGNFENIGKWLFEIDKRPALGRIVSVDFNVHQDKRTKRRHLTANVVLNKIKLQDNET